MRFGPRIIPFLLISAGCLVLPSLAGAATIGPLVTSTPIPLTTTDWSGTLDFPKFDPVNGTLNSVQIDLNGYLETTITVTNDAGSSSSGTAKTEVVMTVQDGGNNLNAPELDMLTTPYAYSLSPGGSTTSGLITKSGSSSDLYTLAAILAEFTGTGSISLSGSTFTQTLLANTGGNTAASQVTSASLTGTVTYNYTPVPEPSTLMLLGLGLVTLGIVKRRRRK